MNNICFDTLEHFRLTGQSLHKWLNRFFIVILITETNASRISVSHIRGVFSICNNLVVTQWQSLVRWCESNKSVVQRSPQSWSTLTQLTTDNITHHIRVLHPVDAVPVSQVGLPVLVIITGVRGLVRVGCCGGVHWNTAETFSGYWSLETKNVCFAGTQLKVNYGLHPGVNQNLHVYHMTEWLGRSMTRAETHKPVISTRPNSQ